MVTKNQHIPLSPIHVVIDQPGYFSVYFERPPGFVFEAGDWIDLQFVNRDLKGGITYSISSSPTEPEIRISFREGVSEFKQALQTITSSDEVYISQYGNDYDFRLHAHQSSVLIAGGIGIAPFRSMLKQLYDDKNNNRVTVVYLNQTEQFLFRDELDTWAIALPNVSIRYIPTREINRKKREKLLLSYIKTHHQNFYISGPPSMVESNEHLLIDNGVQIRDIRIDSFGGY